MACTVISGTLSVGSLRTESVEVDLSDKPSLSRLDVDAGLGELTIDLSGDWVDDFDVDIRIGAGKLTLVLPQDVGVRADVDCGLTRIYAGGFDRDGGRYANYAFGESEMVIRVNIQAGVGNINLEPGG